MIAADTIAPLILMALLCVVVPEVLASRHSVSQPRLAGAMAVSALLILGLGAVVMAALYARQGSDIAGGISAYPFGVARYFIERSFGLALFWGPLLALVWLIKAQAVEARKGRAKAQEGRGA